MPDPTQYPGRCAAEAPAPTIINNHSTLNDPEMRSRLGQCGHSAPPPPLNPPLLEVAHKQQDDIGDALTECLAIAEFMTKAILGADSPAIVEVATKEPQPGGMLPHLITRGRLRIDEAELLREQLKRLRDAIVGR